MSLREGRHRPPTFLNGVRAIDVSRPFLSYAGRTPGVTSQLTLPSVAVVVWA